MKKQVLSLVYIVTVWSFMSLGAHAEEKLPHYQGHDQWALTFEDEFQGEVLDPNIWTIRGSEFASYHDTSCTYLENGDLVLKIKKIDNKVVLGRIDTNLEEGVNKFEQKYGFFECRAKIPPVDDTYFAFWMTHYPGVNLVGNGGRDGAEIDIIESAYSSEHSMHTVHWDGYGSSHKSAHDGKKSAPGLHNGEYHIFGLEWEENFLKFYVDGDLKWTYTGEGVPRIPEFPILSSGTGSWVDGNINNAALPYEARVDWIRIYEKTIEAPQHQVINSGFEAGNASGWATNGSATVSDSESKEGTYSAKLTGNGWFEQTVTGLESNTTYAYKTFVKTDAIAKFCVKNFGSDQIVKHIPNTNGAFVETQIQFTTGANDTSARICYYHWNSGQGTSYADEFSIVTVE